jgi:hypothetical protein
MCLVTLNIASLSRWTRCYHVSYSSGSLLPAKEDSAIAACLVPPDPMSLLEWAPALTHVLRLCVSRGPEI